VKVKRERDREWAFKQKKEEIPRFFISSHVFQLQIVVDRVLLLLVVLDQGGGDV